MAFRSSPDSPFSAAPVLIPEMTTRPADEPPADEATAPAPGRLRLWHTAVGLPAALYGLLHLLALRWPSALWGVDALAYYGPLGTVCFLAMPLMALTAPVAALPADVRDLLRRAVDWRGTPWLLGLLALPLFWMLRVRLHTLGDSIKWFAIVENALTGARRFDEIPWHNAHLSVPGLEFINVQQALDLVLHVGLHALLRSLGTPDAQTAYELLSVLVGGLYVVTLWALARRLVDTTAARLAAFAFLTSLGTLQLFCGYGESYTVVTWLTALYLVVALDRLAGRRPLWLAAATWVLAVSTHMLAAALAPSLAYLIWRDPRWGPHLRRRAVGAPIAVLTVLGVLIAWTALYRGLHLPLVSADAPGRYALLSLRHAATLGNALLLCGPFGLLWGLWAWRAPGGAARRLLGLAAAGPSLLILMHDITMGGRDWDLMSYLTLPLGAWGLLALRDRVGDIGRPLGRVIVPLMTVHTFLWIGVNADAGRTHDRLESLLWADTNQREDYRWWARGYFYLEQAEGRASDAVDAFTRAIAHAQPDRLDIPGTREFSYRQFLAGALARAARDSEALATIRGIREVNPDPVGDADDIAVYWDWARLAYRAAELAAVRADSARASGLWHESAHALERLVAWEKSRQSHHDYAVVLRRLGRHRDALDQLFLGLPPATRFDELLAAGDNYRQSGRPDLAVHAYGLLLRHASPSVDGCVRLGICLHDAGDVAAANMAFGAALQQEIETTDDLFAQAFALLVSGRADEAMRAHAAAVERAAEARALLQRHWPGR
jgi:tetratricopeptide (TPR) repeat protein